MSTISRLKSIFYNKENFYNFIILSAIMIVVGAAYAYNGLDMRNTKNMLVNPIIFFLTDFIVVVSAGALIEIPCIGRKKNQSEIVKRNQLEIIKRNQLMKINIPIMKNQMKKEIPLKMIGIMRMIGMLKTDQRIMIEDLIIFTNPDLKNKAN